MIQLNEALLVALDLPGRACTAPTRSLNHLIEFKEKRSLNHT
jgi:hypothetical protein